MDFQINALPAEEFSHLYGRSDKELHEQGVERILVDQKPGYPCRVSLVDCEPGETVLLMNFEHQPDSTAYRSRHAIFVREGARTASLRVNSVPQQLRIRTLSLRGFDTMGTMLDAEVTGGEKLEDVIERLFKNELITYLHVHNAARGCFAARVDRTYD